MSYPRHNYLGNRTVDHSHLPRSHTSLVLYTSTSLTIGPANSFSLSISRSDKIPLWCKEKLWYMRQKIERDRDRDRDRERERLTAAWIYEVCGRQPPPWQVWWPDSGSCGCHSRNRSAQSHTPLAEVRDQRRGGNGERKNTNYRTHENICRFNQQPCTLRHHLAWNVFQSQTPGIKWFQSVYHLVC